MPLSGLYQISSHFTVNPGSITLSEKQNSVIDLVEVGQHRK